MGKKYKTKQNEGVYFQVQACSMQNSKFLLLIKMDVKDNKNLNNHAKPQYDQTGSWMPTYKKN